MNKVLLMLLCMLLVACDDPKKTDAKQLSYILKETARSIQRADDYYASSQEIFNSYKMGKPIYQVHDEMKHPIDMLGVNVDDLMQLKKDEVPKIQNPAIRQNIASGLTLLIDVYNTKYNFLSDARHVLEDVSVANSDDLIAKYKDKSDGFVAEEDKAFVYFTDAKKLAGLPDGLEEFK